MVEEYVNKEKNDLKTLIREFLKKLFFKKHNDVENAKNIDEESACINKNKNEDDYNDDEETAECFQTHRRMGMFGAKLRANFWKCFHVRKRHYFLTGIAILVPIILFAFLGYARTRISGIGKQVVNTTSYATLWTSDMIYEGRKLNVDETMLYFAPSTPFTDQLMEEVIIKLGVLNDGIKGFPNEYDLIAYYKRNNTKPITYAVVFQDLQGDSAPTKLKYNIRNYEKYINWETNELYAQDTFQYIPDQGSETYLHKGFIVLQLALDQSFLEMQNENLDLVLTMQEFPYPPHVSDLGINDLFMHMLPFVTLFSFLLTCPSTLKNIVEEKDSGIKELMKMMGLPPSIMWLCWFLDALLMNFFSIFFIVFFMKWDWNTGYPPIEHINCFIFGLFLFLYCCACISLCFFISTFFQSPNYTTITGILIWIITYIIPYSLGSQLGSFHKCQKAFLSLIPNVAMHYGYKAISSYELRGMGIQWDNLFKSASDNPGDLSMGCVIIMLIVDTILLLVLTLYLDAVMPGEHGLPKSWTFPFSAIKNRIKKFGMRRRNSDVNPCAEIPNESTKIETCNSEAGLSIRGLYKKFGDKYAVDNLTIDFYSKEITILLGHNGAGKSTTLSILTGLLQATKGKVSILDYDLNNDLDYIRSLIGICPQHNLFFPDLSVREHLLFFGKLKCINDLEKKVDNLIKWLKLEKKQHTLPDKLSGGMKRKLCLGMAIISNPKVLILDEPTSGLDPKSRRDIWDLLLEWRTKNNATVILSTHFMEEAEALGDRIAIIDHGRLMCYGTPMYLKKLYSTGYLLTIAKCNPSPNTNKDNVPKINIAPKIKEIIPEAELKSKTDTALSFLLPIDKKEKFPELLKSLEDGKDALGIDAISVSATTLEDVFLKVSDKSDSSSISSKSTNSFPGRGAILNGNKFVILFRNHWNSFSSIFLKTHIYYILIATGIFLLTVLLSKPSSFDLFSSRVLKLDLNIYGNTEVYLSGDRNNPKIASMIDYYQSTVEKQRANVHIVDSVSEALINMGVANFEKYKQRAIVAAEFNETQGKIIANAMYSNAALHGAPIALNLLLDTIAKEYINPSSGIMVGNEPLTKPDDDEDSEVSSEMEVAIIWMLIFPMALLFLVGSFIIHPFKERISNMKHLLYMTGIRVHCYWLNMFAFDFSVYVILIVVLSCLLFTNPLFNGYAYGGLVVILIIYGIVAIPYVYLYSYRKTVASGFGLFVMLNLFAGVVLATIVTVLTLSGDEYYENWGHVLHVIFHFNPQYWLTYQLIAFSRKAVWIYNWDHMDPKKKSVICYHDRDPCCFNDTASIQQCDIKKSYLEFICWKTVLVLLMFVIYMFILWSIDNIKWRKLIWRNLKSSCTNGSKEKKNSVRSYNEEPNSNDETDDGHGDEGSYTVTGMTKTFKNVKVVNDIGFKVSSGHCMGLLGVNGAGKTTTFKMLTCDEVPCSGNATLEKKKKHYDIYENHIGYMEKIGYCPQYNAINGYLTGRQLLTLFAKLRDVKDIEENVDFWIKETGLNEYADVKCGLYSGGNMRKLSLAIALIGLPEVLMLDEPTTGVDPLSRRALWDILKKIKSEKNQNIILTSHSMDECEELCDELIILESGKIMTKGTIPKLKEIHGHGFTIFIKLIQNLEGETVSQIDRQFKVEFQGHKPELKDEHATLLRYELKDKSQLSTIFEKMEKFKNNNSQVQDYIITMTTLEDILLNKYRTEIA